MILNKSKLGGKLTRNVILTPFDFKEDVDEFSVKIRVGQTVYFRDDNKKLQPHKIAGLVLKPGEVYLIEAAQTVNVKSAVVMCTLNERMRRLGLVYSPGFFYPGYEGKMLFAVSVARNTTIKPGDAFISMHLIEGGTNFKSSYDGKYNGGKI